MNTKVLLAVMAAAVLTVGYFFGPFRSARPETMREEVVFEADSAVTVPPAAGTVQHLEDGSRIEVSEDGRTTKVFHTDGSQTTTSNDGFGNSTQTRFYVDNTRIKGVAVVTASDGSRTVRIYAANGAVVTLDGNALRDPLNSSVSELANAAGIYEEDRPGPPSKPVELTDESAEPRPAEDAKADGKLE